MNDAPKQQKQIQQTPDTNMLVGLLDRINRGGGFAEGDIPLAQLVSSMVNGNDK